MTKSPGLSPDERLALIAQLWDSLDDHHVQLTPAQQAELERRLATLDQDRTQSVTWETLKEGGKDSGLCRIRHKTIMERVP
jgi:putative addiction module component (TIGR02574 family)